MTNALSRSDSPGADGPAGSGDWQQLRGELNSLLDGEAASRKPAAGATAESESRHQQALRSVNEAIARLNEREEVPSREDANLVRAAIAEIRARQAVNPESNLRRVHPPTPFAALATAISTANDRLGEIETQLREQRTPVDLSAITEQIAEMTRVVELLAAAVGESGEASRLEQKLEEMGQMLAQGGRPDLEEFTRRLEDLASSVQILTEAHARHAAMIDRFAELQNRQGAALDRIAVETPAADLAEIRARLEDVSATVTRLTELQIAQVDRLAQEAEQAPARDERVNEGFESIERALRAVYDRLDEVERRVGASSPALEEMSEALAALAAAISDRDAEAESMMPLLTAVSDKIDRIEAPAGAMEGLRADFAQLESQLSARLEPRFQSIESQIGKLARVIAERQADPALGQMELQLRQLVARMDQTGEQLAALARVHAGESGRAGPDLDAMARAVAEKAGEAIARLVPQAGEGEMSEAALAAIEARMLSALERNAATRAPEGLDAVSERLGRLEAVLAQRLMAKVAPEAELREAEAAENAEARAREALADAMPRNPEHEAPLVDIPLGDPVPPALGPGLEGEIEDAFHFEPRVDARPPRPVSSLEAEAEEAEKPAASSRNAFIAAHRAAMQRSEAQKGVSGSSIIGRALARLQAGDAAVVQPEPQTRPLTRKERKAEERAAREAARAAAAQASEGDAAEETAPSESFLARNSKPILLGASLIAIAALGTNLVMHRVAGQGSILPSFGGSAAPAAASDAADGGTAQASAHPAAMASQGALPAKPRVIPLTDPTSTASIDPYAPGAAADAAAQPMPATPAAGPTAAGQAAAGDGIAPAADTADEASAAPAAEQSGATATPSAEEKTTDVAALAPAGTPEAAGAPGATPSAETAAPDLPAAIGPDSLRQAALAGDERAEFEIGAIYTEGRVVPADMKAAALWYRKAAEHGFAPAEYRLASLYETGTGLDKDLEQARTWYERAAEAGNRMSMHNLAALYAGGQLGKQDFPAAAKWFEKAAELGLTDSQFNLGMLYARGLGVPQNLETSYKWFALAAETGDKDAVKAREDVARSLDAATVSRLKDEVAAWKPRPVDFAANFAPIGTWDKTFDPGQPIADRKVVERVQFALERLGFDVGTPDGVVGPKTAEAIKSFEQATGMTPSGEVNPRLLAVLGSQPV